MRKVLCSVVAAVLAGGTAGAANAQADAKYPTRTVTIVAPSAPGGSYSIYAQLLADGLEKRLGQPFIVENRPGAGTVTGTNQVAKGEASGHTLLMGATPGLAINVSLRKSIPYDVKKELTPVALFASAHQVLMVNAELPIRSVADIARIAKEKPGSLKFASNGPGTVVHFAGETLKSMLGVDLVHIPYKGIAPAINDVAAGHVSMIFTSLASAGSMLHSGRVRLLGVTSPKRLASLPDVPPLSEVGLPGFDVALWYMVMAPANTPQPVVERLNREIRSIVTEPEVRKRIVSLGAEVIDSPPPDKLKEFLNSEIARWGKVIDTAGLAKSM